MKDRNIVILTKIIQYANEIRLTINTLEVDSEKFENDFISRNAISMCLLQIRDLLGKLSDEINSELQESSSDTSARNGIRNFKKSVCF